TPKEIDVYLALLKINSSSIAEIMSRANVSRKSIYEILQKLLDKGLVSYTIKDNRKQFNAASPERFIEILKEKEANLETILPELLKKHQKSTEEIKVEVFIGTEGMKTATNIILKEKKKFYVLANEGRIFEFLKYYMPQFQQKALKLGIRGDVIYSESARDKKLLTPAENNIRYVSDKYNSPMSIAMYGNNVNILIYSENNPIAIHLKSKDIAQSFMNYFNLMWNIGKG
ncbi:MAG: helix-turn-helix domain-containing protein, partial [archaeon]|nr:helix-turn-helix domain-containing protein [archaeon]